MASPTKKRRQTKKRKPVKKKGRPTKINPELTDRLVNAVRGGVGLQHAAILNSLAPATLQNWMNRGKTAALIAGETVENNEFLHFYREVSKARATAISLCEGTILHAAVRKRDWKAAVTYLERQVPAEWGRKDMLVVAVDGALQEMLDKVRGLMPVDHFNSLVEAIAQVKGVTLLDEPELLALPAE